MVKIAMAAMPVINVGEGWGWSWFDAANPVKTPRRTFVLIAWVATSSQGDGLYLCLRLSD